MFRAATVPDLPDNLAASVLHSSILPHGLPDGLPDNRQPWQPFAAFSISPQPFVLDGMPDGLPDRFAYSPAVCPCRGDPCPIHQT